MADGGNAVDASASDALRRCSEQFLAELQTARVGLGPGHDLEWRAHVESAARLAVPLLHATGGSRAALQFVERVAEDGGVEPLVQAGVAKPLARLAARACATGEGQALADTQTIAGLLTRIFEAGCGARFAEPLESAEIVACMLVALEGPRAPRFFPDELLDKVEGSCLDAILTTALSRVWNAPWCPETCECVCELAARTFAASAGSVETFLNLGGVEVALGARDTTKVLRLFGAVSDNVASAPRQLRLPDAAPRLRCKLVDAIVRACYGGCPVARGAFQSVLANEQLCTLLFESDALAAQLADEFLRRVDRDEAHAARLACRGFARGMARALRGKHLPPAHVLSAVVRAYFRTEASVADRGERVPVCEVLCHWCVRAGGFETQLVVLRDAFKLLTTEGGGADAHEWPGLEQTATLLLECVDLPASLSVPREHGLFLVARSLAGRKCPSSVGVLGRRFRRLLAEVADQFADAYADNRPMLQHALDVINFYDVLCETTRETLLRKLRALPPGPPEASLLAELKCPITLQPLVFPVLMPDTNTYELEAIVTHFLSRGGEFVSPLTRARMALAPVYNRALSKVAAEVATRVHGRRRRRTPPLPSAGVDGERAPPRQF